jgi:hypothetical protein
MCPICRSSAGVVAASAMSVSTASPTVFGQEDRCAAAHGGSARSMPSFRADLEDEFHASLEPEDVARAKVFYASTRSWV